MSKSDNISAALLALTSSALALPGISKAAVPPEQPTAGFRYTTYTENPTEASKTSGGKSTERYDISVFHANGVLPYSEKLSFTFDFDYETMSGATPWYVGEEGDKTVVVMSGASVDDSRMDISGSASYYIEEGRLNAGLGLSSEEDYKALYGSLSGLLEFYNKHVSVDVGLSFSSDKLAPTEHHTRLPGNATRVQDERKSSVGLYAGFTQVLNRVSTFQTGVGYTLKTGYLTDPYKLVLIGGVVNNENRPNDRSEFSWMNRYRLFVENYGGTLHLDYRFYTDNWGLSSHMIDASWYHPLPDNWQFVPGLRYYMQSATDFYEPFYTEERDNGVYSSDYRLSDFSATSFRFQLNKDYGAWKGVFSFERYSSSGSNPALVDFELIMLGLDYKF